MLYDFDSPDCPAIGHADVCVIGAGAAGILLATTLSAAGKRVTLLEGGGREQERRSQELYRSQIAGLPYEGIHHGRFRTYGGTTTQWGGQILELDDFDFGVREHVAGSGWPFPKTELTPYYERALHFAGLRRVERDDAKVWAALGLGKVDLGPDFSMLYSRWLNERNFAVLHERELTQTRKLSVYVHASVTGLEMAEGGGSIAAATVRSFSGKTARVTADEFVVCMGGIEGTRLLLQPLVEGIAPWQANGMLGKHYQDHIGLNGVEIAGVSAQPAYRYFGYVTEGGFRYHNKLRMTLAAQVREDALNVAGTITPFRKEDRGREQAMLTLRQAARDRKVPGVGAALQMAPYLPGVVAEQVSQRLRGEGSEWKRTMLTVHCEQEPFTPSRITLAEERDELGMLRTRLDWQITEREIASMRAYVRVAAAEFAKTGFARVEAPKGFFEDDGLVRSMCGDSNHHMGGCRMSASAADGIVDADLKLHGVSNGYVCSCAVFPSTGFSNPTHTMLALAVRLAEKLGAAAPRVEVLEPVREVALPGSGTKVPQLGFGCAYLLGPGLDRAKSRRLLDAAWDAGVRHYDVARLYGQGQTEALLGEFLKGHPDATVTTKYGVVPPTKAERVVQALGRRVPGMGGVAGLMKRNERAKFDGEDARKSLELSLRMLGRDRVELFLLHEPFVDDLVRDDLLAFLERARTDGKIGQFGVGGEYFRMQELFDRRRAYTPVMQFEWSIFGPNLAIPGVERIHYRTFAKPAAELGRVFEQDPGLAQRWSEVVGAELEEPMVLSRLMLKAALEAEPESLMLFSTRSEEHIFDNMEVAADVSLAAPARRLLGLVREADSKELRISVT